MEFKACFKCGEVQPLSEFYANPRMADGLLNKCKACARADMRLHRATHESVREYDRKRGARQPSEYQAEYRRKFPRKDAAQLAARRAVQDGELIRPSQCEVEGCERGRPHAHHDDYAQPLAVRWLCALHHKRWHRDNGEGKNGDR